MTKNIWGQHIEQKKFIAAQQRRAQARQRLLAKKRNQQLSLKQKLADILKQQSNNTEDEDENTVTTQPLVDKDVKSIKQQQQEQSKHEQDKIDELQGLALDKIDKVQKDIDMALAVDPSQSTAQQVLQTVKSEIKASQQEKNLIPKTPEQVNQIESYLIKKEAVQNPPQSNFRDLSLPFSRGNYLPLVEEIINRMSDLSLEEKNKLYNRYRFIRGPNRKFQTSSQLVTRLNALYGKYQSWKEGHARVNHILKKINAQLQFMNKKPQKWYLWYLKNVLHMNQASQSWETMTTEAIMSRQLQRRRQSLNEKKEKIMTNIHYYYRKFQQLNLTRVQKLTQLMQQRTEVYQQQKKVLAFLVDEKTSQITQLEKKMTQDKATHEQNLQNLQQTALKVIEQQRKKEKQLMEQIKTLEEANEKDQSLLKAKNDQLKNQQSVIQAQQQKNKEDREKMIEMHLKNMQLSMELKATKQSQRNELIKQQQNLTAQYSMQIQQMNQYIQQILAGKQMTEYQYQMFVNQHQLDMLQIAATHKQILEGKQAEFAAYQQRVQLEFQNQRRGFQEALLNLNKENQEVKSKYTDLEKQNSQNEEQLKQLRSKEGFSKQKQAELLKKSSSLSKQLEQLGKSLADSANKQKQLQQSIKISEKKQEEDKKTYMKTMEGKIDEITQQLDKAKQKNKTLQEDFDKKIKVLQKSKQQEINRLVEQLKRTGTQKEKLELNQLQLNRELKSLNELIDKLTHSKNIQSQFLTWKVGGLWTLRQCFRESNSDEKWIASTRGITLPIDKVGHMAEVIRYWLTIKKNNQFPAQKQVMRVKQTDILAILDTYKSVRFFGLRQGYWKDGTLIPTRRGINVSYDQLDQLLMAFKATTDIKLIKNSFTR